MLGQLRHFDYEIFEFRSDSEYKDFEEGSGISRVTQVGCQELLDPTVLTWAVA